MCVSDTTAAIDQSINRLSAAAVTVVCDSSRLRFVGSDAGRVTQTEAVVYCFRIAVCVQSSAVKVCAAIKAIDEVKIILLEFDGVSRDDSTGR